MPAPRIAAVATTRTCSAPSRFAVATWAATTAATSAIFASAIRAPAPIRVKARSWWRSTSRPPSASATSTRVVFVPMSTQAQTMKARGILP